MRTKLRGKVTLLFVMCAVLVAVPAIAAIADDIRDGLDTSAAETQTITAEDSTGFTNEYWIVANGAGTSPAGCDVLDANDSVTATFQVNTPSGVTATPSSLTFDECRAGSDLNSQTVKFTSNTPGTYTIPAVTKTSGTGTYTTTNTDFTLVVKGVTTFTSVSGSGTAGQNDGSLTARLVWGASATQLPGKTVSFAIDKAKNGTFVPVCGGSGQPTCPTTDANGEATLSNVSLAGLSAGTYPVRATFDGDTHYFGTSSTGDLVVQPADSVAPTSTHSLSPDANANGWHNQNVTVTLNVTDNTGGSGVKEIRYSINGGASAVYDPANKPVISTEGTTTFSYFAVDNNNVETPAHSFEIKLDKTAPNVTGALAHGPDHNGWYNAPVGYTFSGQDATSGIAADGCTSGTYSSPDSATASVSGSCTDRAGNSANGSTGTFMFDDTNPTNIAFQGIQAQTYPVADLPAQNAISCSASDATSPPAGCIVSGYDSSFGSHTLTAKATDQAGNEDTKQLVYIVGLKAGEVLSPINSTGKANPAATNLDSFKIKSTVPVKFRLFNDAAMTQLMTNPPAGSVAKLTFFKQDNDTQTTDLTDSLTGLTPNTDNIFRWSATDSQYIYNLGTTGKSAGTYGVQLTLYNSSASNATVLAQSAKYYFVLRS